MSFSRTVHRAARVIGDVEAASKGRLANRMVRRAVFVAVLGVVAAMFKRRRG